MWYWKMGDINGMAEIAFLPHPKSIIGMLIEYYSNEKMNPSEANNPMGVLPDM